MDANFSVKSTGGWIYSLNEGIREKVELSVAFLYPYKIQKFHYKGTEFYPIYSGNILIESIKYRYLNEVKDSDYLGEYLRIIESVKPDVIHIHGTENSFLCILGLVDVPTIVSIQGNVTALQHKFKSGFYGRFIKQRELVFDLKKFVLTGLSFFRTYKRMRKMAKLEQKYLKKASYILGRTDWDRRVTRILAPSSKYYVSNELLRDNFYKEIWLPNGDSGKVVLFTITGNSYFKGFETLCHSLFLLNERGIGVEWRVAGISNDSLINTITRKYLKDKYPKEGLVLLGALDEKELIDNMKNSSIYVMPSHMENSPNSLCEAMMLGMPCIASYAGGTGTILRDGVEGILVQDGDPWSLAGAIVEYIEDENRAIELGVKARERALDRHNRDKVASQLLDIYNLVIQEFHSKRSGGHLGC